MILTSEWVSLGHPDKLADFISCFILDRYLERDPETRFALEVQIKDQHVTLGGEITSKADFSEDEIASFVRHAVELVGYTPSYQKKFGVENTICGGDILVTQHIGRQSPDIAQGVNAGGFGDQGIFFGMAVNSPETDYMPRDWWLARKIGKHLYDIRYAGIDIKTQVSVDAVDLIGNGKVTEVVVAIPMTEKHFDADVSNAVAFCLGGSRSYQLHINGTGRYVKHGPVGDCGTTGRKLAVDFYGGNCRIGGGSPWTKDGTKADLCLNLLARQYAVDRIKATHDEVEYCAISCRIGSPEISVSMRNRNGVETAAWTETVYPGDLIKRFHLKEPRYTQMCRDGLFS